MTHGVTNVTGVTCVTNVTPLWGVSRSSRWHLAG